MQKSWLELRSNIVKPKQDSKATKMHQSASDTTIPNHKSRYTSI